MNQKTLSLIATITGVLFITAVVFVILFGVQIAGANKKTTSEIQEALATQQTKLNAAFQAEKEKTVTKYVADDVFGSFEFSYPKVWSTNVTQEIGNSEELVFLADPNLIVQNKDSKGPFTALRVIVYQSKYASKLKEIESSNTNVKKPMTESDVSISNIKGKKFVGTNDESGKSFAYIILPLRDKTLYIGTDDLASFSKNYDTILGSFSISK